MKKPTVFLFASLVLNGSFAGYIALRPAASPAPVEQTPPITTSTPARTGISDETKRLLAEESVERLDELRDRLRAEGLPESVVRSVVERRLWDRRQAQLDAVDPAKKRPWWQQILGRLPGDDVRMSRLEEKLRDEVLSKRDELFPAQNEARPHDHSVAFLPVAKRQAVQKLRDDYRELQRKLLIDSSGPYRTVADWKELTYLADQEEKDLRALLTSSEYEEMRLRTLDTESSLKKVSALLDLSEHQFRGLVAIQEWKKQAEPKLNPSTDPFAARSPEMELKHQQLADEEKRKLGELLGAEKLQLLKLTENPEYEGLARYVARFDLPQSHIRTYFTLLSKAMEDVGASYNNTTLSPEQRTQAMKSVADAYNASVAKLLGPTALEENFGIDLVQLTRTSCFGVAEK